MNKGLDYGGIIKYDLQHMNWLLPIIIVDVVVVSRRKLT
jgi:hypothetical protein